MALLRKRCTLVQTISHVVFNLSWRSATMSFLNAIKTPLVWALWSFLIQVRTSNSLQGSGSSTVGSSGCAVKCRTINRGDSGLSSSTEGKL